VASLADINGKLFDKAKALVESSGPAEEYIARAVHAADDCYYAVFAAPGWVPMFVASEYDGGPATYTDPDYAADKAREALFNILNANLRDGIEEISN
jgi:hypothetical protein